jgi:hypothetical protein
MADDTLLIERDLTLMHGTATVCSTILTGFTTAAALDLASTTGNDCLDTAVETALLEAV